MRKIAILSLYVWKDFRAQKIARSLARYGFKVKLWGLRKRVSRGPRYLRALLNYLLAMVEISLIDADVYWIENVPDIIYLPLLFLGRKYIYDRRSSWYSHIMISFNNRILSKVAEIIERSLMKRAVIITTDATGLAKEVEPFKKNVYVIPNYPEEEFVRHVSRNLREELKIPKDRKIFLYLATLNKVEGADLLPVIARYIKKLNAELWIVGNGPLRNLVKKLTQINNKVRWFGWVPREEVPNYIYSSDICLVLLHKTRAYVFHCHEDINKIGEYLIFGKPVIATGLYPSKYYLTVDLKDLKETLEKAANNEIIFPKLPKLTWEKYSEPIIAEAATKAFELLMKR